MTTTPKPEAARDPMNDEAYQREPASWKENAADLRQQRDDLKREVERLRIAILVAQNNKREAWDAFALVREEIEKHKVGLLPASENLDGPTFMHEAEALVKGIAQLRAQAETVEQAIVIAGKCATGSGAAVAIRALAPAPGQKD